MPTFRPSLPASVLLLALAAGCVTLAAWQWQRASGKADRQDAFATAESRVGLPPAADAAEFIRVTLSGRFDQKRHLLADNQVLAGRAGVHVYTPFFEAGGAVILVNRGWLPLPPSRAPLPVIETPPGDQDISGRLGRVQGPGRQLGAAAQPDRANWPQLVTYPSLERAATALETRLYPWMLLLDADSAGGFDGRDWQPVYMTPQKHRAYAFQWAALGLLAMACWIITGLRRGTSR